MSTYCSSQLFRFGRRGDGDERTSLAASSLASRAHSIASPTCSRFKSACRPSFAMARHIGGAVPLAGECIAMRPVIIWRGFVLSPALGKQRTTFPVSSVFVTNHQRCGSSGSAVLGSAEPIKSVVIKIKCKLVTFESKLQRQNVHTFGGGG